MKVVAGSSVEIIAIEVLDTYLYVKGRGAFSINGALSGFQEIVRLSNLHSRPYVLADLREVTGDDNVLSLYEVGVQMPQYWKGIRALAIFNLPEQILPDRFWQNVTRNQGLNTAVFDDLNEALEWLDKQAR